MTYLRDQLSIYPSVRLQTLNRRATKQHSGFVCAALVGGRPLVHFVIV